MGRWVLNPAWFILYKWGPRRGLAGRGIGHVFEAGCGISVNFLAGYGIAKLCGTRDSTNF